MAKPGKASAARKWFDDVYEIESAIETLRDCSEALRADPPENMRKHLESPRLYVIRMLEPLISDADVRRLNTFQDPVYQALLVLEGCNKPAFDDARFETLRQHLLRAHTAYLDGNATSQALARRKAGKTLGKRGNTRKLIADMVDAHGNAGIISRWMKSKHGITIGAAGVRKHLHALKKKRN